MKRRNSRGQYAKSLSRFAGLIGLIFTVSVGLPLYYQDHSLVQHFVAPAVASEQLGLDSPVVLDDLGIASVNVSSSSALVETMQTAGEATPQPEPTTVPTPKPKVVVSADKQEVVDYITEVFGEDAEKAIAVANCESGLRVNALNDKNRNGTIDHGVFQINSVHTKSRGSEFKTDWKANVRTAKAIYDEQTFRPWVCAKAIGEKNYLNQ